MFEFAFGGEGYCPVVADRSDQGSARCDPPQSRIVLPPAGLGENDEDLPELGVVVDPRPRVPAPVDDSHERDGGSAGELAPALADFEGHVDRPIQRILRVEGDLGVGIGVVSDENIRATFGYRGDVPDDDAGRPRRRLALLGGVTGCFALAMLMIVMRGLLSRATDMDEFMRVVA